MTRSIVIDPVTRIEGHAKITIHLKDEGQVDKALFHVTQFRGFEKLCEGRPFHEMPGLMARICGICPVSHLMASAKACDALLAVQIPRTGQYLRRIINLAQIIQSHALSFFHLSAPDLLLGMDADPAKRNLFGLLDGHAGRVKDGIRLRKFGQQIIELLGGKRIHPGWIVPGGVSRPLSAEHRDQIRAQLPDAMAIAERTLAWYREVFPRFATEIATFANFQSLFLGLVTGRGNLALYDGHLRIADAGGNIVADRIEPGRYAEFIEEAVEPHTYLKSPYYKPMGYPAGMYRVGPLARLNLCNQAGTPRADAALAEFRKLQDGAVLSSFHYHYARLIEILFCIERLDVLLNRPDILDPHVRAFAGVNALEGAGVAEAPRGTLIHHYRIDENGLMKWANLIIATGHNNLAINRGITQAARHFIRGDKIPEGMLNRVEAVVRCYDPCLSCSTHALGQMPLQLELHDPNGRILDRLART